jgi:protein O-GlcNAc transferase
MINFEFLNEEIKQGNYDLVLKKLGEVDQEAYHAEYLYLLARIAYLNKRYEGAYDLITSLILAYPDVIEYTDLLQEIHNAQEEKKIKNDFEAAYSNKEVFKTLQLAYKLIKIEKFPFKTHMILSELLFSMGKASLAHQYVLKALELCPNNQDLLDNMISYLHYEPRQDTNKVITYVHQFEQNAYKNYRDKAFKNFVHLKNKMPQKIKLGFISGDFKSHVIFLWLGNFFTHLKQINQDLEIFVYCNNPEDDLTNIWKQSTDKWFNISSLEDYTTAQLIYNHGINILIDLSGHTALNRLGVTALRPAPIQISWLGQSAPFGIQNIDYTLVDEYTMAGINLENLFQKVILLPDFLSSYNFDYSFDVGRKISESAFIKKGFISFGSYNNMIKMNRESFDLWIKILKAVPNSRLYLKNHALENLDIQKYVKNYFLAEGINTERLELESASLIRKEYLDAYDQIDISLDPIPMGGTTTNIDVLYSGIPVITLKGSQIQHRASASILNNIKHPELIAHSEEEYVNLAVDLAKDPTRLIHYKKTLREDLLNSNIANAPKFAKDFNEILNRLWREYDETQVK